MLENVNEKFPAPSQVQLDGIGVGCFVQVSDSNNCYWVEVDGEEDDKLTGVVHTELETVNCEKASALLERISFNRKQIVFLGCDRYCFC